MPCVPPFVNVGSWVRGMDADECWNVTGIISDKALEDISLAAVVASLVPVVAVEECLFPLLASSLPCRYCCHGHGHDYLYVLAASLPYSQENYRRDLKPESLQLKPARRFRWMG